MADGLFDFFSRARGQERRAALEGLLTQFIPPELRPQLGLLAEANPIVSMERAGQDAQQLFAPDQSIMDRIAAGGRMASNMAGVLAPAAAGRAVGMAPVQALEEAFTGLSMSPQMMAARDFGVDEFGGVSVPGVAYDPAAVRGQQIMGMLTSGRGSDVTEDMLDMGDPVQNARLNDWLFSNYDLPMDYASRMARATDMGASPEYHGTTTGSDMRYPRADFGSGTRKGTGFFTSDNPYVASSYADPAFGSVFPMMNRAPPSGLARLDASGNIWSQIPGDAMVSVGSFNVPASSYASGAADAGFVFDTNQLARGAALEGSGGIRFENLLDRSIHTPRVKDDPSVMREFQARSSEPSTVTSRQDTRGMRSRFARFDPRLSHLRNLNAALAAGVPLGILSMQPEQEQY